MTQGLERCWLVDLSPVRATCPAQWEGDLRLPGAALPTKATSCRLSVIKEEAHRGRLTETPFQKGRGSSLGQSVWPEPQAW